MTYEKDCKECGKHYTVFHETSQFCNRSCATTWSNKHRQHPSVKLECNLCHQIFDVPYGKRNFWKTCSRKCGRQIAEITIDKDMRAQAISKGKIGKTHKGAPHSEETKRVIGEKAKIRFSDSAKNPMFGRKHSDESRESMSKTRSQRIVDGIIDPRKWARKGKLFSVKANKEIPYRSSWERIVVEKLDADESVTTFQFEPMRIPYYRVEGGQMNLRNYIPDFIISYSDGRRVMVEVKPKCHVDAAINLAKFSAAREYCSNSGMTFEVWTQDEVLT